MADWALILQDAVYDPGLITFAPHFNPKGSWNFWILERSVPTSVAPYFC